MAHGDHEKRSMLYLLCLAPNLPQPTWRAVDIRQDKYGGAHVVISAGWRYQDGGGSKVAQTRFNQELGSQSGLHLVTPGDTITTDTGFMRWRQSVPRAALGL
ncbi:hypothetical protein XELAEV_18002712mg [Xenopus laevis]|uniref:Uncharacterized protein n=1 Tax=Xenopus laevis TaxID=8355 RepID=A0A974BNN1_XENLA|nr:hypothetical protein XELAEV_18002712mg [Xenopus laevis]